MHLQIICDSLSGLHYSHELCDYDGTPLKVVHRDMTPHNVFVTFDGQVKLLDFGIAKLSGSVAETQAGVLKGKLRYMPPEQIMGEPVDRRTDVYAVGVMLWEAVTGVRMWRALSEATIMNRVLEGQIPAPSTERPEVEPELERIVMKALGPEASKRYSTAIELQSELETYMAAHQLAASTREIGTFVSELFTDFRQEAKKAIEEKLAREGSLNWSDNVPITIAESATVSLKSKELLVPQKKHKWELILWPLGISILGALLFFFAAKQLTSRTSGPTTGSPTYLAIPPLEGSAALAPKHVSLRISATPVSAKISVDGKELAGNPVSLSVPGDGSSHSVSIQATDYRSRELNIIFDRDRDVVVALEPAAPATNASMRVSHGPRPSAVPIATAPTMPPKDCDPPFYMDERGIKRIKSGCI